METVHMFMLSSDSKYSEYMHHNTSMFACFFPSCDKVRVIGSLLHEQSLRYSLESNRK